jgi:hypothetical protein
MMYSFAQRSDCRVVDEPFYAAYLQATGLDHPMRDEVLASQSQDYQTALAELSKPVEGLQYEKHMTHHIEPDWRFDWLADFVSVFLIRHPARVIASYAAKRENPTLDDIGFKQQFDVFQQVRALGQEPVILDSYEVRVDPERSLSHLCAQIGIPFDPAMLRWQAGPKAYDGVWAAHWYGAVHSSTGFAKAEGELPALDDAGQSLLQQALPFYEEMRAALG